MQKPCSRLSNRIIVAVIALGSWVLLSPVSADDLAFDREIHLRGTSNTRDIGGYQTSDQRNIRQGVILRSENLSRLTAKDFKKLEEMGLKTVIDLRTEGEHAKAPTVWLGDNPPQFYHFPVGHSKSEWFNSQRKMMSKNRFTEKQATAHMVNGYRMIAAEGASSYQQVMDVVLDQSNWPILIHCNAGKDRAGVAVTLILEAIGVEREAIMEEFLLTNEYGRTKEKAAILAKEGRSASNGRRSGRGPSAKAWFPIVGVQAEMLEAYYETVDEKYGSMDAYLTEIGVDQEARLALSKSLTTEQSELVMGE